MFFNFIFLIATYHCVIFCTSYYAVFQLFPQSTRDKRPAFLFCFIIYIFELHSGLYLMTFPSFSFRLRVPYCTLLRKKIKILYSELKSRCLSSLIYDTITQCCAISFSQTSGPIPNPISGLLTIKSHVGRFCTVHVILKKDHLEAPIPDKRASHISLVC